MSAPSEDAPCVGPAGEEQGPGGHGEARPLHHQQERAEVDVESEIRKSMCCSAADVFQPRQSIKRKIVQSGAK